MSTHPSLLRNLLVLLPLALLVINASGATIASVPEPFASTMSESFEGLPIGILTQSAPIEISIFQGEATLIGSSLAVYIPGRFGPNLFGLGSFTAKVHDGTKGVGVTKTNGTVSLLFEESIVAFGAFWGGLATVPISVSFWDETGLRLGAVQFTYSQPNQDGTLEWKGWQLDQPARRVSFQSSVYVFDSLQAISVPEPSTALSIAFAGMLLFRRRIPPSIRLMPKPAPDQDLSAR